MSAHDPAGASGAHLSIGEVLAELRDEFPDITISKIRFLESQGLIDPERTPSGYRKFYDQDLARLRVAGVLGPLVQPDTDVDVRI